MDIKKLLNAAGFLLIIIFTAGCQSIGKKDNKAEVQPIFTEEEVKENVRKILDQIKEPEIPGDTINLIEFSGQKPDSEGSVDFYPYIQKAIDQLAEKGGGWLLFAHSQGIETWLRYEETYRIEGAIQLKSNVGLIIDRSVRLFFPFGPEKYLVNGKGVLTRYEGTTIYSFSPLIRAFNVHDIAIVSRGETGAMPLIDGDGEKWQRWMWEGEGERRKRGLKPAYQALKDINNADVPIAERVYTDPGSDYFRPEMMEFFLCENILVDGIKLTNSPFWCVKPVFSQSGTFRNMAFDAMVVNNDGIDPESSKNILIENISFGNHDDNVAIKAGRDKEGRDGAIVQGTELEDIESEYINNGRITGPTENVVIRNCMFEGHYAICVGSEMSGGVRNIYALDNYSVTKVNMGFFLKSSRLRGGTVENIYINGMKLNQTKGPVIAMIPNYDKADKSPYVPTFRNIQIENVSSESSEDGIVIHGWSDQPVRNIWLESIRLQNVRKDKVEVHQSEDIVLKDVKVNGQEYDTTITETVDEGNKPPERI